MSRMRFRVLTVNAHKGFGLFNRRFILHELREAVGSVSADVVFLQEVIGEHAHFARRFANWPSTPQYEYLADTMWQHCYGRNAVYPHGDHGNALLSRFPIRYHANHDVSLQGHEARGLLHCILDVPPHPAGLHAICVHLGLRESHRRQQLKLLRALIEEHVPDAVPLVVAGDFNDWRMRGHRELERWGLKEVFVAANGSAARTYPARWPMLRLDRIYARNASSHHALVLPDRPWSHLSDHAPLAAEFEL
jgi:endonuclease/exonuclease/phosphatase family metal-dependent hydrolase